MKIFQKGDKPSAVNIKKINTKLPLLDGVKKTPLSKNNAEQLNGVLKNFDKHLKTYTKEVNAKLGYDINVDYCAEGKIKVKDIVLKDHKSKQEFSIPIAPQLAEEFLNCQKYVIKEIKKEVDGDLNRHHVSQYLCVALMPKGPMLFEFDVHYKHDLQKYDDKNYNICIWALLHGKDYCHLFRHDSYSLQPHTQIFDENGNVINKQIIPIDVFKPHGHKYNVKYAVLFKGKESVGHEDRVEVEEYDNVFAAWRAYEKKFHIEMFTKEIDEEKTLDEVVEDIKKFITQKAKKKKKEKSKKENSEQKGVDNGKGD